MTFSRRLIFFVVVYLLIAGGNWIAYHAILPLKVFHVGFMSLFLLTWVIRRGVPAHPLTLPLLGMGLWVTVSAALSPIDGRMGVEFAWHWWVNILLVFVLVDWLRQDKLGAVWHALFMVSAVLITSMLVFEAVWPAFRHGGLFYIANLAGAFLGALIVPQIWCKAGPRNLWLMLWTGAALAALVVNASRGAWLALIASGLVLAALHWRGFRAWMVPLGALLMMGMVSSLSDAGRMAGDTLRVHLWRSALEIAVDHPLGVGPGLFAQAYQAYATMHDDDRMTGAHNLYLNLLAELGIPGVILAGWLAWAFLRALPPSPTGVQKAALAGLLGVGVHMLVDNFPSANYAFLVGLFAVVALGDARAPSRENILLVANAGAALLLGVMLWMWPGILYAQSGYEESFFTQDVADARRAVMFDPANRLYERQLARLEGRDYRDGLRPETEMSAWALTNYGRWWR